LKRTLILAWFALLSTLSPAEPLVVHVRIYYQQTIPQLTITPTNGSFQLRTCQTCTGKPIRTAMTLTAKSDTVGAESKKYSALFFSGNYRLDIPEHPRFSAPYPLEIQSIGGHLRLTLSLPLEDYVAAVLAAEAGNFDSDQALQAMAVAARTFAVHFRGRHPGFDFCDTTHCQDFRFSGIDDRIRAAVDATEGELLWYQGTTAATYYHQNCGGRTASGHDVWPTNKFSYLREQVDPYCSRNSSGSWQSVISKSDLQQALRSGDLHVPDEWQTVEVLKRTPGGRAVQLGLVSKTGTPVRISASSFRFAVDRSLGWNQIRSDFYEVRDSGQQLVFSGRGAGHGVGLCQAGALEMGHEGKGYRDILSFYYPGTSVGLTAQGFSWESRSNERLELVSTRAKQDERLLEIANQMMRQAEERSGLRFDFHPRLKIYPSIETYRDSTGEPGWVAASTRGQTIRLQPAEILQGQAILRRTLRHEFLHQLIEARARPGIPLWFREGLTLYLADNPEPQAGELPPAKLEDVLAHSHDRNELQMAYSTAKLNVATLIQHNGKEAVLGWLSTGLPTEIAGRFRISQASQH